MSDKDNMKNIEQETASTESIENEESMNNIESEHTHNDNLNKEDKVIISVSNIHKTYTKGNTNLRVLKGINEVIRPGEIVSVTGESGSGKSTFLNLIGGLDIPSRGSIIINGVNIVGLDDTSLSHFRNTELGFIFQFHYLLPDFTAKENVMLPYLSFKYDKKEAENRSEKLLRDVGLTERIDHKPSELSGGEQQRVAIARALINNPKIMLADEPTGNLDEDNSEIIRNILWKLRDKYELTVLLVTHNLELAKKADRVLKLSHGNFIYEKTK
ncbi:MAG: ABC transporter ATP-binding protein [Spirochaetota bacterium]